MEILLIGFIVAAPLLALIADKLITPFLNRNDDCEYCHYETQQCVCLRGVKQ